jgi:predicted phosphodiesterase
VRFVVYNDLHDNLDLWRGLHGLVKDQKFDFAFLNGDVTDYLTDEQQMVGHFLDLCTECFAGTTPFLYARGNHEVRGAYSREMKKFLGLPDDRYYYAFSQGPIRFVVLDSGEDKADGTPVYAGLCNFDDYRTLQQHWLENEIKSEAWQAAKFRVAIFHIPPFYSGDWHGPMDVRRKWAPLLNEGKTDLYIGGHTHKYTVAKADSSLGHDYPVIIGGGPRAGKATVMTVEADSQHIGVKMIRDDGKVVGEIEV